MATGESRTVDPELIDMLVKAVQSSLTEDGLPLEGTRLGHVLGAAYRDRALPTGPGAYKPVMESAVREGRLKKVWSEDGKRMALVPPERDAPTGWQERARETPPVLLSSAGPANDTPYLRREVYEAFSGINGPVALDISDPPRVRIVRGETVHPRVLPLTPESVVQAWRQFADEHGLDPQTNSAVAAILGNSSTTVWKRIKIPGDNTRLRLGIGFFGVRSRLLLDHARAWFEAQGKDPNAFDLLSPPRVPTDGVPAKSSNPGARNRDQAGPKPENSSKALRERLKGIIDRMSVAQLHELWIPSEFLDV